MILFPIRRRGFVKVEDLWINDIAFSWRIFAYFSLRERALA
jgi:hypothetical protein